MRLACFALLAVAVPVAAPAQPAPAAPALPRFDAAASIGTLGGDVTGLPGEVYQSWDWAHAPALTFGVYGTEHLKTEVELGFSGEREIYGSAVLQSDRSVSRYAYFEHMVRTRTLSVTPTYQFLHNTWVHPFLGAGVDVDWDRRRTEGEIRTIAFTPPTTSTGVEPLPEEVVSETHVRLVAAGGVKFYLTRRAFVRTDLRLSIADGLEAARWRVGGGIDF
jgi:hypothetical protein